MSSWNNAAQYCSDSSCARRSPHPCSLNQIFLAFQIGIEFEIKLCESGKLRIKTTKVYYSIFQIVSLLSFSPIEEMR